MSWSTAVYKRKEPEDRKTVGENCIENQSLQSLFTQSEQTLT